MRVCDVAIGAAGVGCGVSERVAMAGWRRKKPSGSDKTRTPRPLAPARAVRPRR